MALVQVVSRNLTVAGTTQTTTGAVTTAKNTLTFFAAYNAAVAGAVTPSDSTGLVWTPAPGFPYVGGATGLTLMAWTANATGNVANTFTFATANPDTPTIFIAEDSGRDALLPVDSIGTGSDSVASSGPHLTGAISVVGGGADVLAFTVSSALAQSYASSGAWAIPPNGTIGTAFGYDAFVQYQNGVSTGPLSNTYSVTVSDKLDSIIIALRTTTQFSYSDEYHDHFNEQPDVAAWPSWYQQFDLRPQFEDVFYEWSEDSGENDAWISTEDQSAPVGAGVAPAAAIQYYGEDAELLDEVLELVTFPGSYQTANNFPPVVLEEPWDWFQEIDDDEWTLRDESNVQYASNVDATSLVFTDPWDWDEDPDDFFADDFGNDDADPPQNDAWDYWLTDDDEYWVDDSFVNINFNPALLFLCLEDGWDQEHFPTSDDDATWTQDDYENDPNSLLNVEDPTWWDEEPDQFDGTTHDLDAVGSNDNPAVTVSDGFDHFATDGDDYVVIDDYALVDVVPNTAIIVDDAYNWFPGDPDDELFHSLNTDPVGPTLIIPFAMPPEDPWQHALTDDDDWIIPDDYAIINVVQSVQFPLADTWDHWLTDDADSYLVLDEYQPTNNKPTVVADGWDHWLTDPDDELHLALDLSPVAAPQPPAIVDPWDWTQDADDEEWMFRSADVVEPKRGLQIEDAWDHFSTDGDDWAVSDDYASVNNIPPPSQFTDDHFPWFDEPAEDNEQDYAVTDGPLVKSVYLLNPYFEVFIPLRPFTVTWGADANL